GTIENRAAFQRWAGRQEVASSEGTAEVQSHAESFSRPFGTCVPCGTFPGVKTPGYSQAVPPGQRNLSKASVVAGGTNNRATLAIEGVAPLYAARTSQRDVPTGLNRYLHPMEERELLRFWLRQTAVGTDRAPSEIPN